MKYRFGRNSLNEAIALINEDIGPPKPVAPPPPPVAAATAKPRPSTAKRKDCHSQQSLEFDSLFFA